MNSTIQTCHEVGLDVLKPSQKDLDHGLELHRDSLVFDIYGFAPRAAHDANAMIASLEAGASENELAELSEDQRMTRAVTDEAEREELEQAWQASGVTCVFQNAGKEGNEVPVMLGRLARYTYATDFLPKIMFKAVTPEDIERAHAEKRHCLYLTTNGVPLAERYDSVQDELSHVRTFFELGVRMMHITYSRRNLIGGGCVERTDAGLSDLGRSAVQVMNELGLIADISHCGWQTCLDTAKESTKPVVISHAVCHAVNQHVRGKSDEVIRAVADTGGLMGICGVPAFLGRSGDLTALLDHIDHLRDSVGVEHIAIGLDKAYVSSFEEEQLKRIPPRRKIRQDWKNFWPADDALLEERWQQPRQEQSLAWTNWPLFTVGMVQRGYTDEDIQKILGQNMLRVTKAQGVRPVSI